jgi:glutathione reductase (NADPH)
MFMKMIVDVATDKVVGVHIVGGDAAEILQVSGEGGLQ